MQAKVTHNSDGSVTVEKDGKKYICFFDQDDFAVYVESEGIGSFAKVTLPNHPGGRANFEYWETW